MKKVIDMKNIEIGDVIRFVDYANDGLVQVSVVDGIVRRSSKITVTTELGNQEIGLNEILNHYKEVTK